MREMMNMGENRVQNGVLDCSESKNEEKFLSVEQLDSSRYAEAGLRVLRGTRCMKNILDSSGFLCAMADQGERYIYERFPYVVLDDTPSSSAGADSDPVEASSAASQATPVVPHTPSSPRPVTPPPPPSPLPPPPASPIVPSPPHSPLVHASAERRQSSSPQRMAPRDEPQTVYEVGESSHQAKLRAQMQQVSQDVQGLRQDLHQHQTTLEDTRTTVLEILTSHLTLLERVNVMDIDTQDWRMAMEEHLRRTWMQVLVAAFWQQVAFWRERLQGWIWMLGMMSIEARLLCLAIVLATIAIILACLPYFLR
ncbi:hypothetical protein E3N88_15544 [Mikania micrantha]|uniref:Uncharacterized protein n=1 Tax=Mikania micrantha TaxID=192012 RepID=A0A5N6NVX5_9ASTR|nr:hypothetical protein E3N88_15544 [Mikania micrantha]